MGGWLTPPAARFPSLSAHARRRHLRRAGLVGERWKGEEGAEPLFHALRICALRLWHTFYSLGAYEGSPRTAPPHLSRRAGAPLCRPPGPPARPTRDGRLRLLLLKPLLLSRRSLAPATFGRVPARRLQTCRIGCLGPATWIHVRKRRVPEATTRRFPSLRGGRMIAPHLEDASGRRPFPCRCSHLAGVWARIRAGRPQGPLTPPERKAACRRVSYSRRSPQLRFDRDGCVAAAPHPPTPRGLRPHTAR